VPIQMKQLFSHHHKLSADEQEALWSQCVFILDANVLLNIYRYADSTREDLFRVLERLSTRVWVPYQAAKEFYKNRITVIKEQKRKYEDLANKLTTAPAGLRSGDFSKSAFLDINQIEGMLTPAINEATKLIDSWKSKHPDLLYEDPYLERLAGIVNESVGPEPDKTLFESACEMAKTRLASRQPPGYKDEKKPEPERYGDILLWFEIQDHAKKAQRPVVLVTDDEKEDWWQIEDGKKLGPRPELREEMRRSAGVEFSIINPARFLDIVGDRLKVEVAPSSVENANEVSAQVALEAIGSSNPRRAPLRSGLFDPAIHQKRHDNEIAVIRWILSRVKDGTIKRSLVNNPFSLILDSQGVRVGLMVRSVRYQIAMHVIQRAHEYFLRAHYEISEGTISDFWLFYVVEDISLADKLASHLSNQIWEPSYSWSVGIIGPGGQYEEVTGLLKGHHIHRLGSNGRITLSNPDESREAEQLEFE
jgi:hypothetical protein